MNSRPLSSDENNFNFKEFTAYLRTSAGGNRNKTTAASITSDLNMFFTVTAHSSGDAYNNDSLFNETNLKSFFYHLKKMYKPTTITKKLRRLKLAVQYTMDSNKSKEHYTRGSNVLKLMTNWCHSLSKDVTTQRKRLSKCVDTHDEHSISSDISVCTIFVVLQLRT